MFDKLKKLFVGLNYAWQYSDIIARFTTWWSRYPGWDDSELLRIWIRPMLQDASVLTTLTKTPIDDIITVAAIRIVDSNTSWTAVYSLARLVHDGFGFDGTLIPQSLSQNQNVTIESIAKNACPDCPAVGLAALGLLMYLLQQRRIEI
jgi:hypothetical protein